MPHWKSMMDKEYLGHWDLDGKDVTVEIASVSGDEIPSKHGKKKKPVIAFKGAEKKLIANTTNCTVIEGMYGSDVDEWIGKRKVADSDFAGAFMYGDRRQPKSA